MKKQKTGTKLQNIPGVGPKIEADLMDIGITRTSDLEGRKPEDMYKQLSAVKGQAIDRCVLYVFRCAVYYAENEKHDPELLKWWNWKEKLILNNKLHIIGPNSTSKPWKALFTENAKTKSFI